MRKIILLAMLGLFLSACGQSGPLYLPHPANNTHGQNVQAK